MGPCLLGTLFSPCPSTHMCRNPYLGPAVPGCFLVQRLLFMTACSSSRIQILRDGINRAPEIHILSHLFASLSKRQCGCVRSRRPAVTSLKSDMYIVLPCHGRSYYVNRKNSCSWHHSQGPLAPGIAQHPKKTGVPGFLYFFLRARS